MQAAVVGFRVRPKPIPCVVWMSALAVLSGTGMLITTFRANSLLLKALFAFTFTCKKEEVKFTLFSDHNGSLIRQQPRVFTCSQTSAFISCIPPHFLITFLVWQAHIVADTKQPLMQPFLAACGDCVQASMQ